MDRDSGCASFIRDWSGPANQVPDRLGFAPSDASCNYAQRCAGFSCRQQGITVHNFDVPVVFQEGGSRMLAPDVADRWRPRTPVARVLQEAPAEAFSPAERVTPLRKPPNFQPAVQRWSFQVPPGQPQFRMAVLDRKSNV